MVDLLISHDVTERLIKTAQQENLTVDELIRVLLEDNVVRIQIKLLKLSTKISFTNSSVCSMTMCLTYLPQCAKQWTHITGKNSTTLRRILTTLP